MAFQLKKALAAYDRAETVDIDCGGGWFITIKPLQSCIRQLAKEQANARSKGAVPVSKKLPSIKIGNDELTETDNEFVLGSYEADVMFFIDNIIVAWHGLKDDLGTDIFFSKDIAKEIFIENGEAGKRLYQELLAASMDNQLFRKDLTSQLEEDVKN